MKKKNLTLDKEIVLQHEEMEGGYMGIIILGLTPFIVTVVEQPTIHCSRDCATQAEPTCAGTCVSCGCY